jgi:hypothetical protein
MSEYAGIVQDELRDLRGNAMVGAVVRVYEVGTTTPATLYDNAVRIADATGADALVNHAVTGLPAASGLLLPGIDAAANYTFFADSDDEYDMLVTWQGLSFQYRVQPKVVEASPGGVTSVNGQTGAVDLSGTYVQAGRVFLSAGGSDANDGEAPGSALLTLPAAIAAAGGDYTRVTISGAVAVAATVTIPHNVTLDFETGAQLVPATGVEVTIQGAIRSGARHIFGVTDGDVFFGPSSWVQTIFPQWFGAVPDDDLTNDTLAVVKTFASIRQKEGITLGVPTYSGPSVHFGAGRYVVDADTLVINNIVNLHVTGDGSRAHVDYAQGSSTIVINGPGTDFGIKVDTNGARNFSMENIAVEYNDDAFTGDLFSGDATGGTLKQCSFTYDWDSEVVGSALRFSANAAIHLHNKEWNLDRCFTTGSQYGVLLEDTANSTTITASTLADHPVSQLATAVGASPIQGLVVHGVYFNVVRLNGSTVPLTRPVNAININAAGFDISGGTWFSGASADARWSGSALILKGSGKVSGTYVNATGAAAIEVIASGSVVEITGNTITGDPPIIHRAGVLVEHGNDLTVTTGGVSTTHVELNPDNDVCAFSCGPSRFRSAVTNSYRAHATGTNQQGVIYSQSLRDGSSAGVSAPAGVSVFNMGTTNSKLAGSFEFGGGVHEGLSTANTTATTTLNMANGNVFDRTLAVGTTTFEFSSAVASRGSSFTLILRHGADGRTVNFPASVKWPSASPPSLSTVSGAIDILTFTTVDGGTTWFGFLGGVAFA